MYYCIKLVLIFIFFLIFAYDCLVVIPERCAMTQLNETYVNNVSLTVRRIKRGGQYAVNLEWMLKVEVGYNVTLELKFYEYLHNEYRPSFVEMRYQLCDVINKKNNYLGLIIRRAGLTKCPVPVGKTSLKNMNLNVDIPSVWPFEHGKGEVTIIDDKAGVVISKGEIVLTFKQ